ncbi:hypothetical protein V8E51_016241 [Hyaloscypha variabilis]
MFPCFRRMVCLRNWYFRIFVLFLVYWWWTGHGSGPLTTASLQVISDQTTRAGSRNLELRRHRRIESHRAVGSEKTHRAVHL